MNEKSIAVIPRTLPEVQSMAEILAQSTLMPKELVGKVPDVVVQILAGQELGLSPMASIRGVHIVQGKPVLSADTMVALVRASGSCEYFMVEDETATSVTYVCQRKGDPKPQRYTWTDEDTKIAGLNTKPNWLQHKKQMRRARCKAILARDVWPDVLAAVYDSDSGEMAVSRADIVHRDIKPANEPDIVDAEVVSESIDDLAKLCTEAQSKADLEALTPRLKQLKDGPMLTLAREAYSARMKSFNKPAAEPAA